MSELEQGGLESTVSPEVSVAEPPPFPANAEGVAGESKKGAPKWLIWSIVAMVGLALLAGAYYVGTLQATGSDDTQSKERDGQKVEASATPTPSATPSPTGVAPTPTPTKAADPYEGWQRFSSLDFADGYNFDFRYPASWTYDMAGKGSGCVLLFRSTEAAASSLCVMEQHPNGRSLGEFAVQGLSSKQIAQRQDKTINGKKAIWIEHVPVMDTGGKRTLNQVFIEGVRMAAFNGQNGYLSLEGRFVEVHGTYEVYKKQYQLISESVVLK